MSPPVLMMVSKLMEQTLTYSKPDPEQDLSLTKIKVSFWTRGIINFSFSLFRDRDSGPASQFLDFLGNIIK